MNNSKKFSVYCHFTPERKIYIGITSLDPEKCWNNGKRYQGTPFGEVVRKFTWDNIKHIVLYKYLSENEAKFLRNWLICDYIEYVRFVEAVYNPRVSNCFDLYKKLTDRERTRMCKLLNEDLRKIYNC